MPFNQVLLLDIVQNVALMGILAYLLTRLPAIRRTLHHSQYRLRDRLVLVAVFGAFSALGNWLGIPVLESMANTRIVGPVAGGLLGGPLVGLGAGIAGAIPRYFMGGFTMWASVLANVIAGAVAGLIYHRLGAHRINVRVALLTGLGCEMLLKVLVLALSHPFEKAWALEKIIAVPTVVANSLAVGLFVYIVKDVFLEQQKARVQSAQQVLDVIQRASDLFLSGFNEKNARQVAQIIYEETGATAVALTDVDKVLAFVGEGADHHIAGAPIVTAATKQAISDGRTVIVNDRTGIGCPHPGCPLAAVVDAPLVVGGQLAGTLKLYKTSREIISHYEAELIQGIAVFLSFQLSQRKLEEQRALLARTEYSMLKAQVNPHFLFNTLGAIRVLVRSDPDLARALIKDLAVFLRGSLNREQEMASVQQELEVAERYFRIEKTRFGEHIRLAVDIPEPLLRHQTPAFTLQPLVENAVRHGAGGSEKPVIVRISAWETALDGFCLAVEDNGRGMDEERLWQLRQESEAAVQSGGIGIYNVDRRIKMLCGPAYGVTLESKLGSGTRALIRLPAGRKPYADENFDR
ncbi:MAG TPA: LytS/YhcK type 5TM receptor domain-containing protein [Patescibacteria group bacterium]|nr:LytS/YhcK type 5TM receptor domain-containing protein [Patescibacteria group bacterium]